MRYQDTYEEQHEHENEHGLRNGMMAFFAGVAAGAALGVLLAPKSGREMREDIAETTGKAREKLDEMIENGRHEWSRMRGKAVDLATMTRDEVNDFIHFLFKEGQDLRGRMKNDISGAAERTSQMADDMRRGV